MRITNEKAERIAFVRLPKQVHTAAKKRAKREHLALSRWVFQLVIEELRREPRLSL